MEPKIATQKTTNSSPTTVGLAEQLLSAVPDIFKRPSFDANGDPQSPMSDASASVLGALIGAGIGGLGGFALAETDPELSAKNRLKQRLKTAIIAAGLGGATGTGLGYLTNVLGEPGKPAAVTDPTLPPPPGQPDDRGIPDRIEGSLKQHGMELTPVGSTSMSILPTALGLLGLKRGKGIRGNLAGFMGNYAKGLIGAGGIELAQSDSKVRKAIFDLLGDNDSTSAPVNTTPVNTNLK